jgi:putative tryptophan/tyrosine transport system substrate-binding protein
MRRRKVLAFLGGAAAVFGAAAVGRAQQSRISKIGVLTPANPEPFRTMLQQALRELGHVVGENTAIEFRSADGEPARLAELAAELVRLDVDVIVASQTPAVHAAQRATRDIPIVMAGAGDPVAVGLVASLARPGGNITGLSATTAEIGGKLLEALREMLPAVQRVAVLANAADPFTATFIEQLEQPARTMKLDLQPLQVRRVDEFAGAFSKMVEARAEAVVVQPSLPRTAAIDLAMRYRLPAVSPLRLFPEAGGLMSYSSSSADIWRRSAQYVDRILKGSKPAELPVEQPIKFELVINLKTARTLGLDVPAMLIARADEVIE